MCCGKKHDEVDEQGAGGMETKENEVAQETVANETPAEGDVTTGEDAPAESNDEAPAETEA